MSISDTAVTLPGEAARPYLRPQNLRQGLIFAFIATLAWSTTAIFIDRLLREYHMTPLQIGTWRNMLIAPTIGIFLFFRQPDGFRLTHREVLYYCLYGVIGVAIFSIIWNLSVQMSGAAVATALIFSAPVFVAIGAKFIFGEQVKLVQVGAIVINLIGCAMVAGVYDPAQLLQNPAGLLLGLTSGICFGASTLFGKGAARLGKRSSTTILFYTFLFAALFSAGLGLAIEGPAHLLLNLDLGGWLLLIGLSVGPTLMGWTFFTLSLRHLPAAAVSLFTTLEPVLTAFLSLIFLGKTLNSPQWLGTAMIVGGVMLMQALAMRRRDVNGDSK